MPITLTLPESVQATEAFEGLSNRYQFFSTKEVISFFENKGWKITNATASSPRKKDPKFAKHSVTFTPNVSKVNTNYGLKFPEGTPTITFINSHDGSCSSKLVFGLHVKVCSNGLIAPKTIAEPISIRHTRPWEDLEEALQNSEQRFKQVFQSFNQMNSRILDSSEMQKFAQEAMILLGKEGRLKTHSILHARHEEQNTNSLWHVFNRIQKNSVKGGLELSKSKNKVGGRKSKTRAIRNIRSLVNVNQQLWDLAMKFATKEDLQKHSMN